MKEEKVFRLSFAVIWTAVTIVGMMWFHSFGGEYWFVGFHTPAHAYTVFVAMMLYMEEFTNAAFVLGIFTIYGSIVFFVVWIVALILSWKTRIFEWLIIVDKWLTFLLWTATALVWGREFDGYQFILWFSADAIASTILFVLVNLYRKINVEKEL